MKKSLLLSCILLCAGLLSIAVRPAAADDWPAFRGPQRDGICRETGLLKEWPEDGPPLAWKTTGLGEGFSTVSVVGNVLYTQGHKDDKQWVMALDVTNQGKVDLGVRFRRRSATRRRPSRISFSAHHRRRSTLYNRHRRRSCVHGR